MLGYRCDGISEDSVSVETMDSLEAVSIRIPILEIVADGRKDICGDGGGINQWARRFWI